MKNSEEKTTVVDFIRDASFFAELGMRLARRFDYPKALRYLRRAVDLEPENATYNCYLASVLAELGQFEESNNILYHIVESIDPGLVDVYFYLSNNYANMEDFQMAEELALRYLEESKNGTYAEEAEELLDYLYFELDLPPRRLLDQSTDILYAKHEEARRCLEEGRFLQATECLKEIVEKHHDFLPAWNNLALAYYYTGHFSKALETIEHTLELEPGNLHALCNMAVLFSHHNRVGELLPLLQQLKKVVPFTSEHLFKLATTMGVLGQHEEAYFLYRRLLGSHYHQDASTYHYAAISAYLSGRREQAVRWWEKVKQLDPDSGVADYYLQMVKEQHDGETISNMTYHYHVPTGKIRFSDECSYQESLKSDPMVRASLLWALQHGRDDAKQLVIETMMLIADEEAEKALRLFCDTTDDPAWREYALQALSEMGAEPPVSAAPVALASSEDQVVNCINMCLTSKVEREWAIQTWSTYQIRMEMPVRVRKAEAWVAALEYLYRKKQGQKMTQTALAEKYGVSSQTISKCVKEISKLDLYKF
ncbi:MarR family transcriptional regulator [Brevibacillus massiliensis]|uniref:MarR family transcriptional regulator n=1 Tax=Brevibacillus massiliensis TaxID=1118054 RepID=UPI00031C1DB8|nr:helix-turn-helix domain-containing protein [Brevibacillus massiliensis]